MACGHICPVACHDQVLVKIEANKAATPWEAQGPSTEIKSLNCPPCQTPVPITCLGKSTFSTGIPRNSQLIRRQGSLRIARHCELRGNQFQLIF